jgi:predicted Rossmann fold flavoprotein
MTDRLDSVHADGPADGAPIDIAIVGAGAAGLATAIFARRQNPTARVLVVESARRPGAKILVSGGSRCNVTNATVTERDYNAGQPQAVRRILRAFPVAATVAFFLDLGVTLHEEPGGKLFPDTNRSRDVLEALLREVGRSGAVLRTGVRVLDVSREGDLFRLSTSGGGVQARCVVLATGGLSLPKTGSDGAGYGFAARFGHRLVPTTPALVPLVAERDSASALAALSGVSQPVQLDLRAADGRRLARIAGALLWTHFGVSGPAVLDMSRHWLRARLDGERPSIEMSLAPGRQFENLEAEWLAAAAQPRTRAATLLARTVPASVSEALLRVTGVPADRVLADLTRDERRRVLHRLICWPLAIADSRGYSYAEVTAGGVDLSEIDPATMQSRICPGLFLVGEVLDVDGRLGGFNFQWAWATARVAGTNLLRRRPDRA